MREHTEAVSVAIVVGRRRRRQQRSLLVFIIMVHQVLSSADAARVVPSLAGSNWNKTQSRFTTADNNITTQDGTGKQVPEPNHNSIRGEQFSRPVGVLLACVGVRAVLFVGTPTWKPCMRSLCCAGRISSLPHRAGSCNKQRECTCIFACNASIATPSNRCSHELVMIGLAFPFAAQFLIFLHVFPTAPPTHT